ncbi:MucR family transcriptional regulator [Aminobacter sp. SR38]|nr:MucR family transcriptional regulator [Aminobacter sp. SR38]
MYSARRGAAISPVEFTARVVSAYLSNNPVPLSDVGDLIAIVHRSTVDMNLPGGRFSNRQRLRPAVPVESSVTGDYIICLEDGRRFKFIKNHIETIYHLSPAQYREKWNLPSDYPMVAPNYSALRSRMAKELGLGRKTRTRLS